jgi:hypothetical protein
MQLTKKINHLHNDRVANMWRNNVPSVCGRGFHLRQHLTPVFSFLCYPLPHTEGTLFLHIFATLSLCK